MPDAPHKYVKVHEFLKSHPMGVLSTASPDGEPWGAAIYYVADEDFNFYFVTKAGTDKYRNLKTNPKVSLTVADPAEQTTVQAAGTVSQLPPEDYMDIVYGRLAKAARKPGHWTPPIEKLDKGDYMPFRLVPSKLHYADYGRKHTDPHAEYIERIIDGA